MKPTSPALARNTDQLTLALKNRDKGIARVTCANATFIETWRAEARRIARTRKDRTVTADDLREHAAAHPELPAPTHYRVWGAVFRCKDFEAVGMTISRQPQGNGNRVYRWRLRSGT